MGARTKSAPAARIAEWRKVLSNGRFRMKKRNLEFWNFKQRNRCRRVEPERETGWTRGEGHRREEKERTKRTVSMGFTLASSPIFSLSVLPRVWYSSDFVNSRTSACVPLPSSPQLRPSPLFSLSLSSIHSSEG